MAEELQGLLERIHQEGVKKADDEKAKIIAGAKAEAKKIVDDAKAEAEKMTKSAEQEADNHRKRGEAAIQQAARDIILALRQDLQDRLGSVVKECIGEAMTPEFMGKVIIEMVKNFGKDDVDAGIEVIINEKDLKEMEKLCKGSLVESLKTKPEISIGHDFSAGLKIGFKGNDVFFDISDEALADMIANFVGPKLAAMLKPEEAKSEKKSEK